MSGIVGQRVGKTSKPHCSLSGPEAPAVSAQVIKAERARAEAAQAAAPGLSTYELDMLLAKARRLASLHQLTSLPKSQGSLVLYHAPHTREQMADIA